jgi:chromosome segregation ATPase
MPLTEQQVFDAADQVRESGKVPSALNIREITQTGSLGTIQKFLRKWRHSETVSAASINPPPEPMLNAVRQFGEQLWQIAIQNSEKSASIKVQQAREEAQEAIKDADEAMENLGHLQEKIEQLHSEKDEWKSQIQDIHQRHDEKVTALQNEQQDLFQKLQESQSKSTILTSQLEVFEKKELELEQKLSESQKAQSHMEDKITQLLLEQEEAKQQFQHEIQQKIQNLEKTNAELEKQMEIDKIQHMNSEHALKEALSQIENFKLTEKSYKEKCDQALTNLNSMKEDYLKKSLEFESERKLNEQLQSLLEKFQSPHTP